MYLHCTDVLTSSGRSAEAQIDATTGSRRDVSVAPQPVPRRRAMATLTELARLRTALDGPQLDHLQRLVASWGLLADFCFADLLLFAPRRSRRADGERFVVLGQIRPTTSQTLYRSDWVGDRRRPTPSARSSPAACRLGEIIDGEVTDRGAARSGCGCSRIPVRHRRRRRSAC